MPDQPTPLVEPYPGAAADLRRSLALMAHYLNSDLDGVAAIVHEASNDPRPDSEYMLLLAIADLAYSYSPVMRHPDATTWLRALAARCTAVEDQT